MNRKRWHSELRATLLLATPLIIAQLGQMALFTTDVIVMGWLGPAYLAAGTLATSAIHPLLLFGIGTLSAVAPMVAQARGAKNVKSIRRSARQGFWCAILLSIVLIPILWQVRWILHLLGQAPELAAQAEIFMHAAVWSIPGALLFMVLRCLLSAHGATRAILVITLIGVAVNALSNYLLVFGHWGFPRMELRGSGLSTAMTNTLMFLLLLGYVLRHRRYKRYHVLARFWKPDWQRFFEIFRIGTPIGLLLTAEVALFSAAAVMMGWLGTAELAAHAVAIQCAGVAFMIPLGLSQATTIRIGLAHGSGDAIGVGVAGWVSYALGTGFILCSATLLWLIPETLISFFLDRHDPANEVPFLLAVSYLGVAALFQLADVGQVIGAAALRGMSDTAKPMFIAIGGYWILGLPISYLLGFRAGLGGLGIWYGLAIGLACVAAVLLLRFALREKLGLVDYAERG